MVDQLTLQTIGILLTGLTVSIAAIYYTLTLRYTRRNQDLQLETRQTQLFMQLYQQVLSKDAQRDNFELINLEWEDYEDFEMKYGSENNPDVAAKRYYLWRQFDAIGYLLKKGLIDADMVFQLGINVVIWQWAKWEPIITEIRVRYNMPE